MTETGTVFDQVSLLSPCDNYRWSDIVHLIFHFSPGRRYLWTPTPLIFSTFHYKMPRLQAEWNFLILWKNQLFSAKYLAKKKMSCSAAWFPLLCGPLSFYQTAESLMSDMTDTLSPVLCTNEGLDCPFTQEISAVVLPPAAACTMSLPPTQPLMSTVAKTSLSLCPCSAAIFTWNCSICCKGGR